jgi:hypothetical protein
MDRGTKQNIQDCIIAHTSAVGMVRSLFGHVKIQGGQNLGYLWRLRGPLIAFYVLGTRSRTSQRVNHRQMAVVLQDRGILRETLP